MFWDDRFESHVIFSCSWHWDHSAERWNFHISKNVCYWCLKKLKMENSKSISNTRVRKVEIKNDSTERRINSTCLKVLDI